MIIPILHFWTRGYLCFDVSSPSSSDENLERLSEAGFVLDRMAQKCRDCEQITHNDKLSPEEKVEKTNLGGGECASCNEEGLVSM